MRGFGVFVVQVLLVFDCEHACGVQSVINPSGCLDTVFLLRAVQDERFHDFHKSSRAMLADNDQYVAILCGNFEPGGHV